MGDIAPKVYMLECKACHSIKVCITTSIIASVCPFHFTGDVMCLLSLGCARSPCIKMVHIVNRWMLLIVCCKRSENTNAKNFGIVVATTKHFLADWLLKTLSNGDNHHLHEAFLEIDMERFTTLASPNNINFVLGLKRFVCSGMGTTVISPLSKDHLRFKFVKDNCVPSSSLLETI